MEDVVNRLARELAAAVAAAVAVSPEVEACRAKARAAGYEVKLTLEAVVGFASRTAPQADGKGEPAAVSANRALVARRPADMTANDRRFLRSLRIAADEATETKASE